MTDSFRLDSDGNLRSALLEQFAWLRHGFGTRSGTVPPFSMATVKQIHSADILEAEEAGLRGEGDALISAVPGLAVGVKTADCVPILLVDPVHHVVAAVHAGWRGAVKEIVALTVARMAQNYETNPIDLFAAIGPAIGACCYEVGPEVAGQFAKWDARFREIRNKSNLDLKSINFNQLEMAGVTPAHIARAQLCTNCNPDIFFSYRREAEQAGRMMSWIAYE